MKLNKLYFLIIILLSTNAFAQYSPYFENYTLSEYKAGNQNWGVSRADNGKVYVANNDGLLEYDGLKWDFMQLPNKTTIRSVLTHENLIYTGSYEEFGYWKKNSFGKLIYSSLSNKIKEDISADEEFWQISLYKDIIIFRSFLNIYLYYPDGKIKKIKPESTVIACNVVNDNLYVSTLKNGIYLLKEDALVSAIMFDVLVDTKVVFITQHKNQLLLITSLKGCFIYDNNKLKPINFEVTPLIKQHLLNSFTKLENGQMIFGTIKNGLYFTNDIGEIIFHVNKENGLINNSILDQYLDKDNKLWLGLDNGVASVDLSSNNYFFNDVSGKLGAVYDVIEYKGIVYIGSNTGLFFLDNNNQLQFVKGSQGQVWNLKEIDGKLFCGHNEGTFIISNQKLSKISPYTGGWTIKKVPEQKEIYIQGTYAGLVRFKKENQKWTVKHLGNTTMPFRFLVFEDQTTAWAAHAYKGLYKIKFDANYDTVVSVKNYENKGLLSNYNVRVYKIKNSVCFKTNEGWHKYEPLLDSIVPYKFLNEKLGKDSYIISEDDITTLLAVKHKDIIKFKSFITKNSNTALSSNYYKNRLIVGNERVSRINDSVYALNLNDGFILIGDKKGLKTKLFKPKIEKIEINKAPVKLDSEKAISVKFNNSVRIHMSSAKSEKHFFEYALLNLDSTKWYKLDNSKLELSNLNNGLYTIGLRASNDLEYSSKITFINMEVLPPWYRGKKSVALYVLFTLIVFSTFYFLHKRKINKEQEQLQIKYEEEQKELLSEKALENEKKIVQLKNESLKNEIKLKSKQLANTAMAIVKKNETLLEIKDELTQNKNSFDNYYTYKKLLKKVNNSIAHKDEWEVFEYNFNQVHEEFFNSLKSKYSELTHKDLKICAYIKMNLSTKEIAPLMNISVRGVETHRYRLKKKMNLDNDTSLTNYLLNFK